VNEEGSLSIVAVPEVLRDKLGPEGAQALVELLNRTSQRTRDDVLVFVEERFERRLAEEIGKVRADMAAFEARVIRWMFIFWVGQIGVLTGILFAFFRS
jgi:hypothetical protein